MSDSRINSNCTFCIILLGSKQIDREKKRKNKNKKEGIEFNITDWLIDWIDCFYFVFLSVILYHHSSRKWRKGGEERKKEISDVRPSFWFVSLFLGTSYDIDRGQCQSRSHIARLPVWNGCCTLLPLPVWMQSAFWPWNAAGQNVRILARSHRRGRDAGPPPIPSRVPYTRDATILSEPTKRIQGKFHPWWGRFSNFCI